MSPRINRRLGAALVFALMLALALAACGGSGSDTGTEAEAAVDTTEESGDTTAASTDVPSWCGDKQITLALADGFGDNNWRKITRAEAEEEASKCPNVTEFEYSDGQGDTQKSISDIEGLAAQGVDAMVVFPDAGKAVLPAITNAYNQGVVMVPYRVSPGGEEGVNYDYYVSTKFTKAGELMGEWLLEAIDGKGKVLPMGGPAGNTASVEVYEGLGTAIADSDIELIGEQPFAVTNWDPAKTQQVLTASLAKYPEIDAIVTDFGAALASSFPAFEQAGREIPPVATQDSNELSCDQVELGFPLFTYDSQTWQVRTAVQFAVAAASEGEVPASTEVEQRAFENSITGEPNPVECNKELSGEAILSSELTPEELAASLK